MTGFLATEIVTSNGTVLNFMGTGAVYTFDLTPRGDGLVTADIPGNVAVDAAAMGNVAAAQFSRVYDTGAPTVAMSSVALDPTGVSPIPVTVTFSEPVTGFLATEIVTSNGTVSNFMGTGAVYTFDLTPGGGWPGDSGHSGERGGGCGGEGERGGAVQPDLQRGRARDRQPHLDDAGRDARDGGDD